MGEGGRMQFFTLGRENPPQSKLPTQCGRTECLTDRLPKKGFGSGLRGGGSVTAGRLDHLPLSILSFKCLAQDSELLFLPCAELSLL